MGKEASDIHERKKTLPLIHALEEGSVADRRRLRAILGRTPDADGVAETMAILERSGSRDFTRERARHHRDAAIAQLEAAGVVDGEAMLRLRAIVESAISA